MKERISELEQAFIKLSFLSILTDPPKDSTHNDFTKPDAFVYLIANEVTDRV